MDKVGWEQGELQVLGMEDILTSRNNCSKCSSETFLRIRFFRIMPYFIEDGSTSTPDGENFSNLKLSKVVVPNVSNIISSSLVSSARSANSSTSLC